MGRRRLPHGEILLVRLQYKQNEVLEQKAAFGIVVLMMNRLFHEEGM